MNRMPWFALFMLVFVGGCGGETTGSGDAQGKTSSTAQADIQPSTGQTVMGTSVFTADGMQVTLVLTLEGLSPNAEHAVHIHEMPDCGMDGMNAMGHWNPTNAAHGKWGMGAYHRGDIGNVLADGSGKATLTMSTDEWAVSSSDEMKDVQNHAIMVHASPDDFTTQPTGNAGARIGCGVIKPK
jgi:superoxide dismutase, Cu-Zn family